MFRRTSLLNISEQIPKLTVTRHAGILPIDLPQQILVVNLSNPRKYPRAEAPKPGLGNDGKTPVRVYRPRKDRVYGLDQSRKSPVAVQDSRPSRLL